jgi:diguanylate cyclase (GGDEF)-like protein/PAS domain S-box-containing protein
VPRRILLIQDDVSDAKAVRDALINSSDGAFRVEWVRRRSKALKLLISEGKQEKPGADRIAAVLVDLFLPDSQGIETFDRLYCIAPQIPILVLTTVQDEQVAKLAVQHGAQDYLLKARLDAYLLPKALGSMIERAAIAEALFEEQERAQVTLNSIGDAVMSTDVRGHVTYLNAVAESMTGWSRAEAAGRPLEEVFRIVDAATHEAAVNPMALAIRENKTVGLTVNCLLIRRDGVEAAIEDSAAPIHDRRGRVTGAVIVFHDVSAARALSLRMSYLARHDSLTDLPNRILLNDRLAQAISLAHRHRYKLALLFLDVDRLKHINDSLGHAIGDRLLQSVAQRLLACVRSSDTVSRQGGDEFVILLSELTHERDAAVGADKILQALRAPHRIDRHDLHVTASIGIATYPDDGTEAERLLKNADSAMYHAKDNGRDHYQFFKPDMNERAIERQSLESGLRHAIDRQQLVLHYQPKINLETGAIIGVEALIRWNHSPYGLVPPVQFIPIAEECGLIVPIGRWVLREACRQARAWQDAGLPPTGIAINISAVELRAKDFVAGVRAILAETGLQPHYLELELTETFLMQDSDSTAAVLEALKDMGVQLALDDFGTGYSSLSYLRRFPIDSLKIDQSFVCDLTTDADDASIVTAMIGMGKSLQMRVVAEGVQTSEQLAFLQRHGCPEGQGYYFSRPVAAGEFARLLGRANKKSDARDITRVS